MDKLNELIEWMEGELDVVKKNNAAAYLYRCGVADTLERNITKAKELEAANCDHKDCRNSGKDLRQELIEKGYDMNQYPDQVTDHDRASTDQVPDKSYPAKTPEQIAAELCPYMNIEEELKTIEMMNVLLPAWLLGYKTAMTDVERVYKSWLQETKRSGSVIMGKSMSEFFTYLTEKYGK